jgi:hypothetical protein
MKEILGKMRGALSESGYSFSIIETERPKSLIDSLFPAGDGAAKKARARFQELCEKYEIAELGSSEEAPTGTCGRVAKMAPKLRDALMNELVHQRLAGHYFISQVEPDGSDAGHVVLLREIQALPRPAAQAIEKGLDSARFNEMCAAEPRLLGRLRIESRDLAMPLSIVRSPNIEHLMQAFSLLFSRIGIADPDPAYLDSLWARQPSVGEE